MNDPVQPIEQAAITTPPPQLPPKKHGISMVLILLGFLLLAGLGWWYSHRNTAVDTAQSYENSQYNYHLDFPKSWFVIGGQPADIRLSNSTATDNFPEVGVRIVVEDAGARTLHDVALQGRLTPDQLQIEETTIANEQAIKATTIGCDTDGFVGCGQTIRYILHRNRIYTFDPLLTDKAIADTIFDTFRFTN